MNTSEVLSRAAEVIRERGFFQKNAGRPGLCALTAINHAVAFDGDILEPVRVLGAYLGFDVEDTVVNHIIAWNDDPERTAEEVTTALEVAALIAGAKAQPVRTFEVAR